MILKTASTFALMLCLFFCAPALAEETPDEPPESEENREEFERNDVGVFLGITAGGETHGGGRESGTGTIAIEYRRRLARPVGIGFMVEYAGGDRRDYVAMVPVTVWLSRRVELIGGLGWERASDSAPLSGESNLLARLGIGYSIDIVPGNTIRPEVNFDFVDGERLLVAGVSIAWGF